MEIERFKKEAKRDGVDIIPVTPQISTIFQNIVHAKGLFKYIDFDCQISNTPQTKTGHCKTFNGAFCCCHSCKGSVGFLRIIPDGMLNKYARHFSVKTGYWRQGKGCILNHTMRSTTCLTYNCNEKDAQFRRGISQIKNILSDNERKIVKLWKQS